MEPTNPLFMCIVPCIEHGGLYTEIKEISRREGSEGRALTFYPTRHETAKDLLKNIVDFFKKFQTLTFEKVCNALSSIIAEGIILYDKHEVLQKIVRYCISEAAHIIFNRHSLSKNEWFRAELILVGALNYAAEMGCVNLCEDDYTFEDIELALSLIDFSNAKDEKN